MKVAAIRIGMPASASLPSFCDWPADLAAQVEGKVFMLEGSHDYDGRPFMPLDVAGLRNAARQVKEAGIGSAAIASSFSPLDASCEETARKIFAEICPDVAVTLSHTLGRIGLLERENAALLNAALRGLAVTTISAFRKAIADSGTEAPLYLTQNDGTVMQADVGIAFPVMSFASGATNSMRGAADLSGLDDAMVIDVGGTTSDVGQLRHGFPREANSVVEIGGVRTLFRMPDLLSIGLGGGSHVDGVSGKVGPLSVGYRLTREARVFGGGAFLVPERLAGVSEIIRVPHGDCANAVGAAIAQVSGEADQVFRDFSRNEAIEAALGIASDRVVRAGADRSSLKTIEVEDIPISYLPGNALRVRVRVAGIIADDEGGAV